MPTKYCNIWNILKLIIYVHTAINRVWNANDFVDTLRNIYYKPEAFIGYKIYS